MKRLGLLLMLGLSGPGSAHGTLEPLHTGFLQARGVDALVGNPANLGLPGNPFLSLSLLDFRAGVWNNVLSVKLYERYNGKYLTEEDKEELLDHFRGGWRWAGRAFLLPPLFSFTAGRFGLGAFMDARTSVTLSKAPLELALKGLVPGDRLDLTDIKAQAYFISGVTAAYAHVWDVSSEFLRHWGFSEVSTGVALKYLTGWAYAQAEVPEGELRMGEYYAWGSGRAVLRTAGVDTAEFVPGPSGRGFALDVGVAAQGSRLSVGLALKNLGGRITWRERAKRWEFAFKLDSLNVAGVDTVEKPFTSTDTSYAVSEFSTAYPDYLVLGASYRFDFFEGKPAPLEVVPDSAISEVDSLLPPKPKPPNMLFLPVELSLTYRLGFEEGFGIHKGSELILGVEAGALWGHLPLSLYLRLGGEEGVVWVPGLGLRLGPLRFSVAYASRGHPLPLMGRGVELAMNLALSF